MKMKFLGQVNLSKDVVQYHSTLIFESLEDAQSKLLELADNLAKMRAKPSAIEVFSPKKYIEKINLFKERLGVQNCPTNIVLPLDETSTPELAGVNITSICGTEVLYGKEGNVAFSKYTAGDEKYFRIFGDSLAQDGNEGFASYTERAINSMKQAMLANDFSFSDTVRTWFYNHRILDWYADFNKGRTKFFNDNEVFKGLLPASTGIGSPNPENTPIQCGLIAVKDAAKRGKIIELKSPLQNGATEYGSSFSRAIEMHFETYRYIMVSGTASIAPNGETCYFGDIKKQVELTMDVIEQILKSREMSFQNTTRAVVYCMNPQYYQTFLDWQNKRNLRLPHCPSYSTVCRHNLMFEVELDAAKAKPLTF